MSTAAEIRPPQVRWNLSSLFDSLEDPRIEESWAAAAERAARFAETYRGKIEDPSLSAQVLSRALIELEELSQEAFKPVHYGHLLHACDTGNPQIGAFMQKQMEHASELSVTLLFFELELQAAPEEAISRIIEDPSLANYRHYIQVARAFSPHRLSEPEEIILEEVSNTGDRAWKRLFEEVVANHVFRLRGPGAEQDEELTEPEVLDLLRDPDRELRQAAADSLTAGLKEIERVLVFTYNNLMQDKRVEDRLRKMPYPEHSRHLSNELDKETVDLVMRLCRDNYGLVERFYNVKREILGLPVLTHIDRYAPLSEADEQVEFDRAKDMILEAFGAFSAELRERANEFFDKEWIDAEPRPGKRGGAFCSYNTPDTHPVVFLSYLNKMDNVMTLAHELGHGVHASLSRAQTLFNFHGTLPLAELASTFGEMLVFEKLVADASPRDRLALYAEKIEGVFATVFRQAAMFRFEQRCHEKRRAEGELTPEAFGDIWQEELQAMFGSSIELGEQHRMWWSYISHFISVPFYVYAYSFGELLVLSLYQMGKDSPDQASFAAKYVELLQLGGSRSPQDLMATVGIDIKSEAFWNGGFAAMEKLVAEFERIWASLK